MMTLSRRAFLATAGACFGAGGQHTVYGTRDGEQLVVHQRAMGVTRTVVLPVGTRPGLKPGAGVNQSAVDLARKCRRQFVFFANPVPDDPNTQREIENFSKPARWASWSRSTV